MNLSAPKQSTFLAGAVLGAVGIVGSFVPLPVIGAYVGYLLMAGFLVLVAGNLMKGL